MRRPTLTWALALLTALLPLAAAQDDGYIGYRLEQNGDPDSAVYQTSNTDTSVQPLPQEPDVYLNASVSVKEISIQVDNITAKVNLDARVLNLLHFTAGVDASIDRVRLLIQDVKAKVELEARLGNVVGMVDDVLRTVDLNPIVATLGRNVGRVVDAVGDVLESPGQEEQPESDQGGDGSGDAGGEEEDEDGAGVAKRDLRYNLAYNILYSVNNYSGRAHTNRVLAQNGDVLDIRLDNQGRERGRSVVGSYLSLMAFNGHNRTIEADDEEGVTEFELQYVYAPFPAVEIVSAVYTDGGGEVLRTEVIAGATGGGMSTFTGDKKD